MPFGALTRRLKEACIRWGQSQTNPFATAMGDMMRCGLSSKFFDLLLCSLTEALCIAFDFCSTVYLCCAVLVFGDFGDAQHIGCFDQACDVLAVAKGLQHVTSIRSSTHRRVM